MKRYHSSTTLVVFCCSALPEENTVKPRTSRSGSMTDQNISIQNKTLSPPIQPKLTGEKRKTKHSEKV